jgi:hypothetical protein
MNVLVAGEGKTELGRWAIEPQYRADRDVGVLEAIVVKRGGCVVDGVLWKNIRKFRAGNHRAPETRTVLGLALEAKERALILVFVRDRDGDDARRGDIDAGVAEARHRFPGVRIAGRCAVESVEALGLWALVPLPGSSIRVLERDGNILIASGIDHACLDLGPAPLLSVASSVIASPSSSSVVTRPSYLCSAGARSSCSALGTDQRRSRDTSA